jgi:2-phosphosulfolactate phosphatase
VLLGSLLNLDALVRDVEERGEDVAILCAGFKGAFALDDAYCAGRIVQELAGSAPTRRSPPSSSRARIPMRIPD